MRKIQVLEQKSEIGAGTRGSSLGIDALKIASLNAGNRFFKDHISIEIENQNHLLFTKNKSRFGNYIEGMVSVFKAQSSQVEKTLKKNLFPLVLSADHASAGGTIAGIKAAHPKKRLGVIWIDAHADLHSPYTSPTGNIHGMPLATALASDNMEESINEVSEETARAWNQLKASSGIEPKIDSEDLIFFGVRDTEEPEDRLMKRENILNYKVANAREKGMQKSMEEALKRLEHCDILYISFDVDSMDCDLVSYGTGTPVPNGFSPEEAKELLLTGLKDERCVCLEFVEVNPTLDNKQNKMADTAFEILTICSDQIENTSP